MKINKFIKITLGLIVFLLLAFLLFFGFLFIKYDEDLPVGIKSEKADVLANKMLNSLNYQAYQETDYIEWSFKNRRSYKWNKRNQICTVQWKEFKVDLHLKYLERSRAAVHSFNVIGQKRNELVKQALDYFNNDSFWLVAPYKVFDRGVERSIVKLNDNKDALLVTYSIGGSTPGDSYLWEFDDKGKPVSFKMWTSILPIGGIKASWTDWTKTESGALLPNFHKLLFLAIEIAHIKGEKRVYQN